MALRYVLLSNKRLFSHFKSSEVGIRLSVLDGV